MLQNRVFVGNIVKLEDFGRGNNKLVFKQFLYFYNFNQQKWQFGYQEGPKAPIAPSEVF